MKILLVNSNPVVSRLTSLSARKESVELDEIKDVSELKNSDYNIVFVDSDSFSDEISAVLKNSHIKRKVLFYTRGDLDIDEMFNYTILKPFLPSEVSTILRDAKIDMERENSLPVEEKPKEEYMSLDDLISSRKDTTPAPSLKLFEDEPKEKKVEERETTSIEEKLLAEIRESQNKLDDRLGNIEKDFDLELKDLEKDLISIQPTPPKPMPKEEKRSVEPKLEPKPNIGLDMISDPIFDEEPIVTPPPAPPKPKSEPKPKPVKKAEPPKQKSILDDFDSGLFELDSSNRESKKGKSDIDTLNSDKNMLDSDLDLFVKDIKDDNIKKEVEDDDILMLDVDSSNEVDFGKLEDRPKVKSKKIEAKRESIKEEIDKDEVSKVNDFLDKNLKDDITVTPLVPKAKEVEPKPEPPKVDDIEKREDILKGKTIEIDKSTKETPEVVKRVFKDTVGSLPIEELRQLLRGTKIHITVEFPKDV